jgi:hypothetical protein
MLLSEVFLKIVESYNYISTKDARLWYRAEEEKQYKIGKKQQYIKLVENLNETLEDYMVRDGDVFMVETKFNGRENVKLIGKFPRDKKTEHDEEERDWRDFEVGDKVDFLNDYDWKIGRIVKTHKEKVTIHFENESYKNDITVYSNSSKFSQIIHTQDTLINMGRILLRSISRNKNRTLRYKLRDL